MVDARSTEDELRLNAQAVIVRLQSTRDEEDGAAAINYLDDHRGGDKTFLFMTSLLCFNDLYNLVSY